jgi:hypothetical protein
LFWLVQTNILGFGETFFFEKAQRTCASLHWKERAWFIIPLGGWIQVVLHQWTSQVIGRTTLKPLAAPLAQGSFIDDRVDRGVDRGFSPVEHTAIAVLPDSQWCQQSDGEKFLVECLSGASPCGLTPIVVAWRHARHP